VVSRLGKNVLVSAIGQVVILNGAPRSGKTAIARAIQEGSPGTWVNLGVDASMGSIPERLQPGIGLRPGGERPDLEELVVALYAALYESIAAHARMGLNVVVDTGHHESYSRPLHLADCAKRLVGLPVLWVGVRCPIEVIWQRREASWGQRREEAGPELIAAVQAWQQEVHAHRPYDLELDTSRHSPGECARIVAARLAEGPPGRALGLLAATEPDRRPSED
jgi:chloramphenicol 3-O phosphotransferase